ncbi:MAG: hypothetical protein KBC67_02830 [Candidatus Pacebacteria bacterium]|nr:hypothetical protein [Candidatus Paceibacterota bacterium]
MKKIALCIALLLPCLAHSQARDFKNTSATPSTSFDPNMYFLKDKSPAHPAGFLYYDDIRCGREHLDSTLFGRYYGEGKLVSTAIVNDSITLPPVKNPKTGIMHVRWGQVIVVWYSGDATGKNAGWEALNIKDCLPCMNLQGIRVNDTTITFEVLPEGTTSVIKYRYDRKTKVLAKVG